MSEAVIPARIRLLRTATRHRASGWRCVCRFEGVAATDGAEVFGVEVQLAGRDRVQPGEQAEVRLRVWAADVLPGPITAGTSLSLMEGAKEVATGEVMPYEGAGAG